jgi:hypothetical protein
VPTTRDVRLLRGEGWAVGTKFKPGAAERPLGGIVAVEEQSRNAWTTTCARSSFVGAAATGSSKCSCTRPSCRQHRIRLTSAPG